jgi:hypothetical protein
VREQRDFGSQREAKGTLQPWCRPLLGCPVGVGVGGVVVVVVVVAVVQSCAIKQKEEEGGPRKEIINKKKAVLFAVVSDEPTSYSSPYMMNQPRIHRHT